MNKLYGFAILFAGAMAAQAARADVVCNGYLGPVTIDDVVVVTGNCTLDRTTVNNNVVLEIGGNLLATRANILGNVQTDGAVRVRIRRSEIGGSIQLTGVYGASRSEVIQSAIGGTLDIFDNSARFLLRLNAVDSDLKANTNTGGLTIASNTVDGNLQCQGNSPAPTGGGNIVEGEKEDQCENL